MEKPKKTFLKSEHKDAIIFSIWNLFGSLMPLWLGALLLKAFSQWTDWTPFFNNGEFYLYSAALLTPAIYLFFRNKRSNHDVRAYLMYASICALVVSAVLFAGLTASEGIIRDENTKFDPDFLQKSSLILFVVSIPIAYFSQVFENIGAPNIRETHKEDLRSLESAFDAINK